MWYDGLFYEKLIAPQADKLHNLLTIFVKRNSTVLDIGCGVGSLVFKLSKKCRTVVGIDLSSKMITHAERKKNALGATNVEFLQADASNLTSIFGNRFDLITIVLFLHEIDHMNRKCVMAATLGISDKIILADFAATFPRSIKARLLKLQEALAGKRHYRNFKDWMHCGGIDGFVEEMNLKVQKIIPWENNAGKVVIVTS